MANADRTYVDPSALRSLYVHDDRSARFARWRARIAGTLPLTRFGRAELVGSIRLAVFRRVLSDADARGAIDDLDADLRDGRLALVDALWRRMLDLTVELATTYTAELGTRTLDVLHVASATTLESTHFVSYDRRQLTLARRVGLRVQSP